jgi:hypothetical protein
LKKGHYYRGLLKKLLDHRRKKIGIIKENRGLLKKIRATKKNRGILRN